MLQQKLATCYHKIIVQKEHVCFSSPKLLIPSLRINNTMETGQKLETTHSRHFVI